MKPSNYSGSQGQIFDEPSLTIPDQTMSIRTIMERYARGLPIDNQKRPIYDDENLSTGLDPRKMDLVDIQEMAEEQKTLLTAHKNELTKKEAKKQKDLFEKEVLRRVENALNKQ